MLHGRRAQICRVLAVMRKCIVADSAGAVAALHLALAAMSARLQGHRGQTSAVQCAEVLHCLSCNHTVSFEVSGKQHIRQSSGHIALRMTAYGIGCVECVGSTFVNSEVLKCFLQLIRHADVQVEYNRE